MVYEISFYSSSISLILLLLRNTTTRKLTALPKYEEEQLMLSVAAGDEQAFSRLYWHYYPLVYPNVLRLVKVPALTEDIVQDIFLKIWEGKEQLPEVKCFAAFLSTVARNHSLNVIKSVARSNHALSAVISHFQEHRFDDEALSNDYRKFIEKAMQTIPPRSREVFRKCREHGMSYEEVAAEMGISRNAVKKHMVASIRILRDASRQELGICMEAGLVFLSFLSFLQ